jgi:hypothetical protein
LERPFAHLFDTGGMRRAYLRGHTNILKQLLIHTGGFNLGLLMRQLIGVGTARRPARAAHRLCQRPSRARARTLGASDA